MSHRGDTIRRDHPPRPARTERAHRPRAPRRADVPRLPLGSTAERVIRKGDTSILVVASRPAAQYERPLVAVDCSDTSRRAVELAWRLAEPGERALEVVNACAPIPESALQRAGVFGEDALQYHLETKRGAQAAVETFLAAGSAATPANIIVRV